MKVKQKAEVTSSALLSGTFQKLKECNPLETRKMRRAKTTENVSNENVPPTINADSACTNEAKASAQKNHEKPLPKESGDSEKSPKVVVAAAKEQTRLPVVAQVKRPATTESRPPQKGLATQHQNLLRKRQEKATPVSKVVAATLPKKTLQRGFPPPPSLPPVGRLSRPLSEKLRRPLAQKSKLQPNKSCVTEEDRTSSNAAALKPIQKNSVIPFVSKKSTLGRSLGSFSSKAQQERQTVRNVACEAAVGQKGSHESSKESLAICRNMEKIKDLKQLPKADVNHRKCVKWTRKPLSAPAGDISLRVEGKAMTIVNEEKESESVSKSCGYKEIDSTPEGQNNVSSGDGNNELAKQQILTDSNKEESETENGKSSNDGSDETTVVENSGDGNGENGNRSLSTDIGDEVGAEGEREFMSGVTLTRRGRQRLKNAAQKASFSASPSSTSSVIVPLIDSTGGSKEANESILELTMTGKQNKDEPVANSSDSNSHPVTIAVSEKVKSKTTENEANGKQRKSEESVPPAQAQGNQKDKLVESNSEQVDQKLEAPTQNRTPRRTRGRSKTKTAIVDAANAPAGSSDGYLAQHLAKVQESENVEINDTTKNDSGEMAAVPPSRIVTRSRARKLGSKDSVNEDLDETSRATTETDKSTRLRKEPKNISSVSVSETDSQSISAESKIKGKRTVKRCARRPKSRSAELDSGELVEVEKENSVAAAEAFLGVVSPPLPDLLVQGLSIQTPQFGGEQEKVLGCGVLVDAADETNEGRTYGEVGQDEGQLVLRGNSGEEHAQQHPRRNSIWEILKNNIFGAPTEKDEQIDQNKKVDDPFGIETPEGMKQIGVPAFDTNKVTDIDGVGNITYCGGQAKEEKIDEKEMVITKNTKMINPEETEAVNTQGVLEVGKKKGCLGKRGDAEDDKVCGEDAKFSERKRTDLHSNVSHQVFTPDRESINRQSIASNSSICSTAERKIETQGLVNSKPYYTINQELFDNPQFWSNENLKELCAKLGVDDSGGRGELIEKLYSWNRNPSVIDQAKKNNGAICRPDIVEPRAGTCNFQALPIRKQHVPRHLLKPLRQLSKNYRNKPILITGRGRQQQQESSAISSTPPAKRQPTRPPLSFSPYNQVVTFTLHREERAEKRKRIYEIAESVDPNENPTSELEDDKNWILARRNLFENCYRVQPSTDATLHNPVWPYEEVTYDQIQQSERVSIDGNLDEDFPLTNFGFYWSRNSGNETNGTLVTTDGCPRPSHEDESFMKLMSPPKLRSRKAEVPAFLECVQTDQLQREKDFTHDLLQEIGSGVGGQEGNRGSKAANQGSSQDSGNRGRNFVLPPTPPRGVKRKPALANLNCEDFEGHSSFSSSHSGISGVADEHFQEQHFDEISVDCIRQCPVSF